MNNILEKIFFILSVRKKSDSVSLTKSILSKVIEWAEEKDSSNPVIPSLNKKLSENPKSNFTVVPLEDISVLVKDLKFVGPVSIYTILYQY